MSGKVLEEALAVGALPILETLELNLSRLLFFGFVNFFPSVRDIEKLIELMTKS